LLGSEWDRGDRHEQHGRRSADDSHELLPV